MSGWLAALGRVGRRRVLGLPDRATRVARRGFRVDAEKTVRRLERIGACFVAGYHAALEHDHVGYLLRRLDRVPRAYRGFAYEGAGMGCALRDVLNPFTRGRWDALVDAAPQHDYLIYVGAGWIVGKLPIPMDRFRRRFDPVLGWLTVDGFGFHEGYFRAATSVHGQQATRKVHGYARRVHDQGLGRCLWFVEGTDVDRIADTIATFAPSRHADLFGGVGLACGYAGGVSPDAIDRLRQRAGTFRPELAQGVAFAATARVRADNVAEHTQLAAERICGLSPQECHRHAGESLAAARLAQATPEEPTYEIWRQRLIDVFRRQHGASQKTRTENCGPGESKPAAAAPLSNVKVSR